MKESYLHALWRRKQIPFLNLKLTDGRSLEIIHYGHHNRHEHGPDFSMGIIVIDGVEEYGPIELHVRSSDWYKHAHQQDEAYNQVILHVVYQHDREVYQNNRQIPTLEIRNYIDPVHRNRFNEDLNQHTDRHGCLFLQHGQEASQTIRASLEEMKQRALLNRYLRKNEPFISGNQPVQQWAYFLLGQAFGSPSNKEAFALFCNRLPLSVCKAKRGEELKELMLKESGLANEKNRFWNKSGFRPGSRPEIRMTQFARLIVQEISDLSALLTLPFSEFKQRCRRLSFSSELTRHLFINAALPFQYALAIKNNEETFGLNEINELKGLPSENNYIIRDWLRSGVHSLNAFDSQSLIALDQVACQLKKCLTCSLGNVLLNAKENSESSPVF